MTCKNDSRDLQELVRLRRWLHQHPELSMQEYETSRFISEYLSQAGIANHIVGETGVIADLVVDEKLPTLAVRAEIDALPVNEQTGLDYASAYPGRMHACGHDAITAVVLYLARTLAGRRSELKCNVRFLFEPAEETGSGARYMIANGALENPRPAGILVFHFGNQQTRSMEIQQSVSTAQIGGLRIQIKGKASHWSQREDGIDAMYAAARLVIAIQEINTSFLTQKPFVLGFGSLQAGKSGNILADEAELSGSLRAFTNQDFESVLQELNRRIKQIERETRAAVTLQLTKKLPSIVNAPAFVERGMTIGRKMFGEHFCLGEKPFLVGDNAAFYMENIPGMRVVFLAGKEAETVYPVHNPRFDIDENVLLDALKFLENFILA
ncbi:MAG: M20 family metallopeptidase [Clostridiales bacterium]|nr:M20 family metallopeptidase [Clostridiales bacterium]